MISLNRFILGHLLPPCAVLTSDLCSSFHGHETHGQTFAVIHMPLCGLHFICIETLSRSLHLQLYMYRSNSVKSMPSKEGVNALISNTLRNVMKIPFTEFER